MAFRFPPSRTSTTISRAEHFCSAAVPAAVESPRRPRGQDALATAGARTHITIPYIAWGLKNPSTFLLHVSDQVEVDIAAVGRLTEPGR
jgi:hypothetical protein